MNSMDVEIGAMVARMHRGGARPSAILRAIAEQRPEFSTVDLMDVLRHAFGLSFEAVQCIGGWWHDGTGELSDQALDAFLDRALQKIGHPV